MLSAATRTASRHLRPHRTFATVVDAAGYKVAALDNGQPTSSITVLVKAGSRYETKPGVAHVLKNFGFKNTKQRSGLGTVREAELYGGVLSTAITREHIAYTAEFLRGDEAYFTEILSNLLTSTSFSRFELEETVAPSVVAESLAASSDPATHAIELAHALAFRSGLGSSLFGTPSGITAEDVKSYAAGVFGKDNVAILGTGIDQSTLQKLVEKHLSSSQTVGDKLAESPKSTYFGGETRVPHSEHTHGAPQTLFIGYGVAGSSSPELSVLASYLNTKPSLKWSQSTSPLSASLPEGTSASVVLLPYSDATLFGLVIQGKTTALVKEAGKAAVSALKAAGGVKSEELKKAVAKAKFEAASGVEGREGVVSTFGPQLIVGTPTSLDSVFASLDKVNAAGFSKATSSLFKAKPTFVAVGDTHNLPYPDEIGV